MVCTAIGRNGEEVEFLLDDEDLAFVEGVKWNTYSTGYVMRNTWDSKNKKVLAILLHRLVVGAKPGDIVDHINGNKLDNRKQNLRIVSYQQNNENLTKLLKNNTSGCRGVSFYKKTGKWLAAISRNKQKIFQAYFDTFEEAAKAVTAARAKLMPFSQEASKSI